MIVIKHLYNGINVHVHSGVTQPQLPLVQTLHKLWLSIQHQHQLILSLSQQILRNLEIIRVVLLVSVLQSIMHQLHHISRSLLLSLSYWQSLHWHNLSHRVFVLICVPLLSCLDMRIARSASCVFSLTPLVVLRPSFVSCLTSCLPLVQISGRILAVLCHGFYISICVCVCVSLGSHLILRFLLRCIIFALIKFFYSSV